MTHYAVTFWQRDAEHPKRNPGTRKRLLQTHVNERFTLQDLEALENVIRKRFPDAQHIETVIDTRHPLNIT